MSDTPALLYSHRVSSDIQYRQEDIIDEPIEAHRESKRFVFVQALLKSDELDVIRTQRWRGISLGEEDTRDVNNVGNGDDRCRTFRIMGVLNLVCI
jgi:hypothetical protein